MSTLGINSRVWVAWWPATALDELFMFRAGDPRLQYAVIKDGPIDAPEHYIEGNFWMIITDNDVEGWVAEALLWPVGGEPMDIPEKQDVTQPVEEHSE